MRILVFSALLVSIGAPLLAQVSGRTMRVLAPTVLGQTATFGLTHPASAAGNPYTFLWCMPPFAGTQSLAVPGFTVTGLLRVVQANSVSAYSGVLGTSGLVTQSLVIPSHPSFLGVSWDLQSVDLALATSEVALSDNDLSLAVVDGPPPHLDMVPISPGTFLMGSPEPIDVWPYYNQRTAQPVHQVTIRRPFWIGRYEVTQALYFQTMGVNPSLFNNWHHRFPVEQVTWFNAQLFCTTLTATERAAGRVPAGYVYRLPTEAEWEYCCRAGTTTEFNTGAGLGCGQAKIGFCLPNGPVVVGSFPPNAWGLYDMHGNVWEWCQDSWDRGANYPAGPVVDPYVTTGPDRVLRGGGWDHPDYQCRSAVRYASVPATAWSRFGFRLVLGPILP